MPAEAGTPGPPAPRRRKRRWLKIIGVLFVLLILFILLIPTIASMGFVRSIVVGKINQNIDGRVEIADYSVGWTGPVTINGIKVYDTQQKLILDVPRVKLGTSLLRLAPGTPLLQIERIAFSYRHEPAELRRCLCDTRAHHYRNATTG